MRFFMRCLQHTVPAVLPLLPATSPIRYADSAGFFLRLIRPNARLRPRLEITHRGLDSVVPGDVLQRKSIRVLSRLGQKRVAQSVKAGIRIELNLITGKLFPETPHFGFEHPGLEFLPGVPGLAEHVAALGVTDNQTESVTMFPPGTDTKSSAG